MVIERGEVWWADLDEPAGSEPGYRRPVLIVQADAFNRSRLQTTIAVVLTSNLRLIEAPGNVLVPMQSSRLPKDSVANVSQLVTLDREFLTERAGKLPARVLAAIDAGLKLVLALP
ncbi:MAG: type II toxin-antitoxin system PemK/MazF family toxin [Gemmatimonadales bacterium]